MQSKLHNKMYTIIYFIKKVHVYKFTHAKSIN